MTAPHILVVEDSPTQARLLRLILEAEGFTVDVCGDGQSGLTRLAEESFDLVVSDVLMQGLTGFELCRTIKADPALSDIPVVLVTTLREPQEIVQALEVGADSFIRKPYDPDALVGRLRSLLAQRPPRTKDVAPAPRRRREDDPAFRGAEAVFNGKTIHVHANREQILRLLLGTFEDVVRANTLLREREEELSVAKRELEEAARMKDIFFATLSHELRTPLTAIVGWVHILKEGQTDPVVIQRAVETIERNLNVQNTLIADLLDVSRIVSGKLDLEMAAAGSPRTRPRLRGLGASDRRRERHRPRDRPPAHLLAHLGRSGAAPTGRHEPLDELAQVHAPRRACRGAAHPGDDHGGLDGDGFGVGDPARCPALRVRTFPPGVGGRHQGGRTRSGACHRQAHRRDAPRDGDGGQRGRRAGEPPSP